MDFSSNNNERQKQPTTKQLINKTNKPYSAIFCDNDKNSILTKNEKQNIKKIIKSAIVFKDF